MILDKGGKDLLQVTDSSGISLIGHICNKNQTIKLPIKNYKESLKNFNKIKEQRNFERYKTFDYRINEQLILK